MTNVQNMVRSSLMNAVISAFCLVFLAGICSVVAKTALGQDVPASSSKTLASAKWETLSGAISVERSTEDSTFTISEIVSMKGDAFLTDYTIDRNIYAIAMGRVPSFTVVTQSLGVSGSPSVAYSPSRRVSKDIGIKLDTWKVKTPVPKGILYLVTSSAVVTFSDGKKALCQFEPIILTDEKVLTPDWSKGAAQAIQTRIKEGTKDKNASQETNGKKEGKKTEGVLNQQNLKTEDAEKRTPQNEGSLRSK
jgi:hypothetical protein